MRVPASFSLLSLSLLYVVSTQEREETKRERMKEMAY